MCAIAHSLTWHWSERTLLSRASSVPTTIESAHSTYGAAAAAAAAATTATTAVLYYTVCCGRGKTKDDCVESVVRRWFWNTFLIQPSTVEYRYSNWKHIHVVVVSQPQSASQPTNEPTSQPASAQKWIHIFLLTREFVQFPQSAFCVRVIINLAVFCHSAIQRFSNFDHKTELLRVIEYTTCWYIFIDVVFEARECVCCKIVNLNSKKIVCCFVSCVDRFSLEMNFGIRCSGHFSHKRMAFEKKKKMKIKAFKEC